MKQMNSSKNLKRQTFEFFPIKLNEMTDASGYKNLSEQRNK